MKNWHIGIILLLFLGIKVQAQVDTTFWFVAPDVSIDHTVSGGIGGQPIYLFISTFDKPAIVNISMPANAGFAPVTLNIPANSAERYDLTPRIEQVENKYREDYDASIPGKNNKGLLIESTEKITAYYESANNNNCDLFALKGKNALGSDFYTPFQNRFYNNSGSNWSEPAHSSIDVVFTEDDTYLTLDIPTGLAIYHGSTELSGTVRVGPFDRGETFKAAPAWKHDSGVPGRYGNDVFGRDKMDHLAGVHIRATNISGTKLKSIAVTISDDSMKAILGGSYDLGGDQIVPTDIIGKEYIAVRGSLDGKYSWEYKWSTGWIQVLQDIEETIFILATEDNTSISIDGTVKGTIGKGETYRHVFEDVDFHEIKADKPVYAWQISGFGHELGAAILPAVDKCTGSDTVSFTRSTNQTLYLNILVQQSAKAGFRLNGFPHFKLEANDFTDIPGTIWAAAKVAFSTGEIGVGVQSTLSNDLGLFHLGIINGSKTGGTRYGYFSGFGDIPQINGSPSIAGQSLCAGDMILEVIGGGEFTTYQWYRDDQLIAGAISDTYTVTEPGRYKVTGITTCNGVETETFPSNTVDAIPCIQVADVNVLEGTPNAEFTITLSHTMPGTDVSFDYDTYAGTADENDDYTRTRGTATIPAGAQEVKIQVPIKQDMRNEPAETFYFRLSNAVNANIWDSEAVGTIQDDGDPEPEMNVSPVIAVNENVPGGKMVIEVLLSELSGYTVTADYLFAPQSATAGSDYQVAPVSGTLSFAPGEQSKTIEVDIVDDNVFEPTLSGYENFTFTLSNLEHAQAGDLQADCRIVEDELMPELLVADVSQTEGNNLDFQFTINGQCSEDVTVEVEAVDNTATRGVDYTYPASSTVTIPAGQLQVVESIPALTDAIAEGVERFTLRITNPVNVQLSSSPYEATGTILDDSGTPQLYIDDVTATEGDNLVFRVHLSIATVSDVTFEYFTQEQTATENVDYTGQPAPKLVTLPAGDLFVDIVVPTLEDTEEEADETLLVQLSNPSPEASMLDGTATGTITDNDETPVAVDDNYTVNEDASLSGNVMLNDLGLGDTPVTASLVADVQHGSLVFNNDGTFTYHPDANFHGNDSFSYRITDADNDTDEAMVYITVVSVNDVPIANDDSFGPVEELTNPAYVVLTGDVMINDTGLGDNAQAQLVSDVTHGTLTMGTDGTFTYVPAAQFFGVDHFSYRLKDDDNEQSAVALVEIAVDYYNDAAPVANNDSYSTSEDTPVSMNVLQNDTDIDGNSTIDVGTITIVQNPQHGSLSIDVFTGEVIYTPTAGYHGPDLFRYTVKDQLIGSEPVKTSNVATVSITVTTDNDPPVAVCQNITVELGANGEATIEAADLDGGSSDPDGDALTFLVAGKSDITFTCADKGVNLITLTVQDELLAQSTCQSQVTVVDLLAPTTTTCTHDTTIYVGPAASGAVVNYTPPVFADNCDGTNLSGTLVAGASSGSAFSADVVTTVRYEYADASGNGPAVCEFSVEVIRDTQAPDINCPGETSVVVNQTSLVYLVNGNGMDATASDNIELVSLTHDYNGGGTSLDGHIFPEGDYTITWTAVDKFGNTSICQQIVHVNPRFEVTLASSDASQNFCEEEMISFTATVNGGRAPYSYVFFVDNVIVQGPIAANVYQVDTLTDAQEVKVVVTDDDGFEYQSNIITVNIFSAPDTGAIYHLPNLW